MKIAKIGDHFARILEHGAKKDERKAQDN